MARFKNPFEGVSIGSLDDLKRLQGIDLLGIGLGNTVIPKLRDMLDVSNPFENLQASRESLMGGLTHLLNNSGIEEGPYILSLRTNMIGLMNNFKTWTSDVIDSYLKTAKAVVEGIKELVQSFADPSKLAKKIVEETCVKYNENGGNNYNDCITVLPIVIMAIALYIHEGHPRLSYALGTFGLTLVPVVCGRTYPDERPDTV
ncbi:hypothetical protein [Paenibacillus sp. IHBB 3054]|uniref:hypothetical protein n=1 Tax=Paenibacillus sp. IHBB 3054 TaxID=3425689 RepID=UPI003F66DAA6